MVPDSSLPSLSTSCSNILSRAGTTSPRHLLVFFKRNFSDLLSAHHARDLPCSKRARCVRTPTAAFINQRPYAVEPGRSLTSCPGGYEFRFITVPSRIVLVGVSRYGEELFPCSQRLEFFHYNLPFSVGLPEFYRARLTKLSILYHGT